MSEAKVVKNNSDKEENKKDPGKKESILKELDDII